MLSNFLRSLWSAKAPANPSLCIFLGGQGSFFSCSCLFSPWALHPCSNSNASLAISSGTYERLPPTSSSGAPSPTARARSSATSTTAVSIYALFVLRHPSGSTFTSRQHYVTSRHVTSRRIASRQLQPHIAEAPSSRHGGSGVISRRLRQHSGRDALGDRNFSAPLSSYGTPVICVVRRGQKRDGTLMDTMGVQS